MMKDFILDEMYKVCIGRIRGLSVCLCLNWIWMIDR